MKNNNFEIVTVDNVDKNVLEQIITADKHIYRLYATKDNKMCFLQLENNVCNKKSINQITAYAFEELDMEEIMVKMDDSDNKISSILKSIGYDEIADGGDKLFMCDKNCFKQKEGSKWK